MPASTNNADSLISALESLSIDESVFNVNEDVSENVEVNFDFDDNGLDTVAEESSESVSLDSGGEDISGEEVSEIPEESEEGGESED
jgi:hypothetical protein